MNKTLERFFAQNGKLELRQFSAGDAEPLFALIDCNRDHLSQFGDTTADKYPTLTSVLESILNSKDLSRLRFGIWREKTLLGTINLTPVNTISAGSVGYWIGSQFTKQRVATEALKAMVLYASMEKGLKILVADTHKDNVASQLVLNRVGFKIHYPISGGLHWVLRI